MDAPVPVQQHTTAWSASPATTARAADPALQAQSGGSPGLSAPNGQHGVPAAAQFVEELAGDGFVHVRGNGDAHMPDPTPEVHGAGTE